MVPDLAAKLIVTLIAVLDVLIVALAATDLFRRRGGGRTRPDGSEVPVTLVPILAGITIMGILAALWPWIRR